MKIAALDLGTNTFLCLIAEGDPTGLTHIYADLSQVVRLGQGVGQTGEFHPEALIRAKDCLTEFKKAMDHHKVEHILAMATSAARDARNGSELFKICEDLKIPLQIIPGQDEARITYAGALVGHTQDQETCLVVDVGGGSTECILGQGDKIIFSESLNIGGVRLTEKWITQQPVPALEQDKLSQYIDSQLQTILPELKKIKIDKIIAVAGTPTSIAGIEVGGFDAIKVDGLFLSKERLKFWAQEFARTSVVEKQTKYNLGGRADIIFSGSLILLNLLGALQAEGLTVSTKGVRYGVALEMLRS